MKTKIFCVNHECTKKHVCKRYLSKATDRVPTRRYAEKWNGKPCQKYEPAVPEVQPLYLTIDEPVSKRGRIQDPRDIELREHLVRMISDNFDSLFMQEMAWRSGTSYNVPHIAGRIVDMVLPVVKRNTTVRKYR